jgi:hypothetical protein
MKRKLLIRCGLQSLQQAVFANFTMLTSETSGKKEKSAFDDVGGVHAVG